jgi:hypothetical protein
LIFFREAGPEAPPRVAAQADAKRAPEKRMRFFSALHANLRSLRALASDPRRTESASTRG